MITTQKTPISFQRGIRDIGTDNDDNDNDACSNGTNLDPSSDDEELDEETTLVEMLGSSAYREEDVLQALRHAFADASHSLREDVIMSLGPVLRSVRAARSAPGRAFITGLLGFDDACKRFEESSYQNAELNAAYAKIEEDIIELFERLQVAYSRLEEKRAIFQKQVKEQTKKMREIINGLPVDVDTLLARVEKKYDDMGMVEGSLAKKKGRERTVQGALAELQL